VCFVAAISFCYCTSFVFIFCVALFITIENNQEKIRISIMLTSPDNDKQNLTFALSNEAAPAAVQEDANANASVKHHDESPLASWFSQYSTSTSSTTGNKSGNSGIIVDDAKKKPATKNISSRRSTDGDTTSSIANNNNNDNNNNDSNTEWGMVSDNEEGEGNEDEEEDEGFNFVAISNSLLMAGRSFEHVSEENNNGGDDCDNNNDNHINAANSDTTRGVLIVDGLNHDNDGSNLGDIGPSTAGGTKNNATATTTTTTNGGNIDSSGTLSIPGSDSLPSDLGTLSHHDEDNFFGGNDNNEDGNHNSGSGSEGTAGTGGAIEGGDPYHRNYPPLIHRFLMNLQQTTRRRRLVSDNNDDDDASRSIIHQDNESIHQDNDNDDDVVVDIGGEEKTSLDHQHRREEPSSSFNLRKQFRGISVMRIMSIALITSLIVLLSWIGHSLVINQRRQEDEWKQRLLQEEEHKARLMVEKDQLRLEMEVLQEQASAAWAQADSLAKEQERWMILQQETERMAGKQKHQHQDQDEEERRGSRKRGRQQQDNYDGQEKDNDNNDDFSWFFNDKNEDCNADRRKNEESGGGSTTYTIADNCWVKAKADINLGSCGDDTKDFFKDVWNGLWYSSWDDWDNYFDTTSSSNTIGDPYTHGGGSSSSKQEAPQQEKEEQQSSHDDAADNDPSQEDPFQELYSVITSAGQFFASKFSQLVTDEVDTTRKAAEDFEDAVLRGYADVSKTFSNTMYAMKDDMRDLSKETLSKLRTAVKNNSNNGSNSNSKGTASKTDRQHSSSSSQSNDDEDATTGYDTKSTTTSSTTTQPVTLQGLNDAVAALSSLSKTLHDTTKSLSSLTEEDAVGRKEHATTDL
jgi:hypothetical protein